MPGGSLRFFSILSLQSLALAAASAAKLALELILEFLELRGESLEHFKIGILLHRMVEQTDAKHKFLCVLVVHHSGLAHFVVDCGKVVVTAKIEIHHFGDFSVLCLNYVDVIGFSFFCHNALFL